MNQVSSVKSYQIFADQNSFQFIIESGVFLSCQKLEANPLKTPTLSDSHLKNKSIGFALLEKDFAPFKIKSLIADIQKKLQLNNKTLLIKIVGPAQLISKWKRFFESSWQCQFVPKDCPLEIIYLPHENRIRVAKNTTNIIKVPVSTKLPRTTFESTQHPPNPIRLLIVDDSKTIRTLLKNVFAKNPQIQVVADTGQPLEVISLIEKHKPHVITLDIHMPDKDGVTLLKEYIKTYPIPTIMISSISPEDGPYVLDALASGAIDYIKKPEQNELIEVGDLMIEKVRAASTAHIKSGFSRNKTVQFKKAANFNINNLIAIGSSTGGTEALKDLFSGFPDQIPPVVVVQHIPPIFSKAFADRLDSLFNFEVKEAEHGDLVLPNRVLIAPGGKQMKVIKSGAKLQIAIDDSAPVNRHKPSVDVLFDSLLECKIKNGLSIILTGMGGDGAKAMLRLRENGWKTIAQDKESCVVFGMPQVAIQLGAAEHVCPLLDIPTKIVEILPPSYEHIKNHVS